MDTWLIFHDSRSPIKTDGGTQTVSLEEGWSRIEVKGGRDRQIRPAVCQENPLRRAVVPVPQTDTCGREEYSQALG